MQGEHAGHQRLKDLPVLPPTLLAISLAAFLPSGQIRGLPPIAGGVTAGGPSH